MLEEKNIVPLSSEFWLTNIICKKKKLASCQLFFLSYIEYCIEHFHKVFLSFCVLLGKNV